MMYLKRRSTLTNFFVFLFRSSSEISSTNKKASKYIGVTWIKRDKRWRTQLNHDKKRHSLGYYKLESDAALAHDEAAKQLKGPNAETNFASLNDYEKAKKNELAKSGLSIEDAMSSSAIVVKVKHAISKQTSKGAGKSVGVGFSDGNEETEDESELAKRVAQDSARRSMRQRSTPELFVARPSKSGVGVKDGDEELSQTSCSNVAAAADKGSGNARLKSEEDSWQCHRCDTSNASARSRCSSCMGWKGGRQGWRYRDEESDEGQDDQCVSKPKRSKFSTRDNKKPSSCIPQAKANGDSTEDSASATAQRCSIKVDREFAKRVAQDSARRSIRQRSAPELFVARPSKSGVGVKDGDEEFLESKTSCSTVAAVTDKRSGSARLKSKDENVEEEDEDSWQCHRCDTSNASTRSRCTSCLGWKGGRMELRNDKEDESSEDEEEEEDSWQCHRCDTLNAPTRSRCSSCMSWKGGRQGWRYEKEDGSSKEEEEEEEEDESCGEESAYDFEDCSKSKRQEWSAKEDKELMKRVRLHGAGNWKTILDNSRILQERYSNALSGELSSSLFMA